MITLLGPWRVRARVVSLDGARAVPARDGERRPWRTGRPRPGRPRRLAARGGGWLPLWARESGALAAAAAVTFVGGSDESTPPANPSPTCSRHPPSASARLAPSVGLRPRPRRPGAAAAPALGVASTLRDPARPRAAARARRASGRRRLGPHGARHRHAGAARGARFRALARRGQRRGGGRVDWEPRGSGLHGRGGVAPRRCASLRFAPTGLGPGPAAACTSRTATPARSPSSARPANSSTGKDARCGAGRRPHGPIVFRRPALRRSAAGDRGRRLAHGVTRTISLPVTLSDLWLASSGRMFAPCAGIDQVAVVDVQAARRPDWSRPCARRWRSRRRQGLRRRRGRGRSPRPPHRPTARQGAPDRARRAADDAARARRIGTRAAVATRR